MQFDNITGSCGPAREPNCGVTAVAIAAGVSFGEAWDAFKRTFSKPGSWRGRTYRSERERMLDHFKVARETVYLRELVGNRRSLNRWLPRLDKAGVYLVSVTGHTFTLRHNGERWQVADQTTKGWCCASLKPRMSRKVVWEIVRLSRSHGEGRTMLTRIYRVEDAEGQGAFGGLAGKARKRVEDLGIYDDRRDPYRHPGPDDCPNLKPLGIRWGSPWFFGFESVDALVQWFDSEAFRRAMNDLGGRMVVYEVDAADIRHGTMQLVFWKDRARVVERLPIPTIPTA